MLDFTSALYLGFEHQSWNLPPWEQLTLGKPAALESPPGASGVERELAALAGCERALLAPSTLHIFGDLLTLLARRDVNFFLDDGTYPVARWGAERAAAAGRAVRFFRRHDPRALQTAIETSERLRPVVVVDGFCPACGKVAPLVEYLECVAPLDGYLVVDDTQAFGILGHSPAGSRPYGLGGGGSLQYTRLCDRRIVVASSMAKAFGAPLAMLAGSERFVGEFERNSATRVHCSPPSVAAIVAAGRALSLNRQRGEKLRQLLAERVLCFRRGLKKFGLEGNRGLFPVQPLSLPKGIEARAVYQRLLDRGIQTVLHQAVLHNGNGGGERISFVLTSRHSLSDIGRAVECLNNVKSRMMPTDLDIRRGEMKGRSEKRCQFNKIFPPSVIMGFRDRAWDPASRRHSFGGGGGTDSGPALGSGD